LDLLKLEVVEVLEPLALIALRIHRGWVKVVMVALVLHPQSRVLVLLGLAAAGVVVTFMKPLEAVLMAVVTEELRVAVTVAMELQILARVAGVLVQKLEHGLAATEALALSLSKYLAM
jgi:hypothetical protein